MGQKICAKVWPISTPTCFYEYVLYQYLCLLALCWWMPLALYSLYMFVQYMQYMFVCAPPTLRLMQSGPEPWACSKFSFTRCGSATPLLSTLYFKDTWKLLEVSYEVEVQVSHLQHMPDFGTRLVKNSNTKNERNSSSPIETGQIYSYSSTSHPPECTI